MSEPQQASIRDVARIVSQADVLHVGITEAELCHVLEIALKGVALASIGCGTHLDLGNGYALSCTLVEPGEEPAPDTAASVLGNLRHPAQPAPNRAQYHGEERRTR